MKYFKGKEYEIYYNIFIYYNIYTGKSWDPRKSFEQAEIIE